MSKTILADPFEVPGEKLETMEFRFVAMPHIKIFPHYPGLSRVTRT